MVSRAGTKKLVVLAMVKLAAQARLFMETAKF